MTPPSSIELTAAQAERFALRRYGLTVEARPLPSYAGRNFLLETAQGSRYVLKVAPPGEPSEHLDLETEAMRHLVRSEVSAYVPEVVTASNGDQVTMLELAGGHSCPARLLTYLPGQPLAHCGPHTVVLLRDLGRFLGRLDRSLETFSHSAAHRVFEWDLRRAARHRQSIGAIASPGDRLIVERLLLQFDAASTLLAGSLRSSVIHNDANDYNILVEESPSGESRIAGLVDFTDLVHTFTVCELAITLAYAMLERPDPMAAAEEIVGGYHETNPLAEAEVEALFPFLCARLCASVLMSARQRRLKPDNEYLTISEKPAWTLLRQLVGIDPRAAHNGFRDACGLPRPTSNGRRPDEILHARRRHLGPSLSVSYERPLKIVRGSMQYLYDHRGRAFLDLVNNVCHVGHCHPRVVAAAQRQIALLNTNTRYLHDHLVEYAERLSATLPEPLEVCFFVCSGSEANELALRLARAFTRRRDVVVLDGAYHGNTSSLIEISPYKFLGPGGAGAPPHVHVAPMPDGYRGPHRGTEREVGLRYAEDLEETLRRARSCGREVGAFFCEPLLGCGGQIEPPEGYLEAAFRAVRAGGGVCVADEVQIGFGRVGSHFWGFETQGVVPDIVTMGKPIGNGHPLAAVVTTPEIATSFADGMEYFNTFGGNPVSCAVGMAVLDVLEDEGLQRHALEVGSRLLAGLEALKKKHRSIGDVRGRGLFIGVELVTDRQTLEPAARLASRVVEDMKDGGFLVSIDGPLHNVLKIKPPMVVTADDADAVVRTLDRVLGAACDEI